MKIAFDALPLIGWAGGKSYTFNLLSDLLDYGNSNFYHLFFRKINLSYKVINSVIEPFRGRNNFYVHKIYIPNRVLEYLWTFNSFNIYGDFLFKESDLYLTTSYFLPIFKKTKIISVVYDITTLKIDRYSMHRREFLVRMGNIIKRSAMIVAISNYTKWDFCNYFKVDEKRVRVIYPSVSSIFRPLSFDEVREFLAKKGLGFKEYFLYVGNLSYHKNVIRLMDAFLKIKKNNLKLVLCGPTRWGGDVLKKIKEENLGESVLIFENLSDEELLYLYNGALGFCYVSLYEGFGLPVVEAMKCGCPVIASNTTSLGEVVGEYGITVDPLNVDEISQAMVALLDERLNKELSAKSLKRAEFFNSFNQAKGFMEVFKEIL